MKAKKLVAVGMTVLMLGGLFVGCGNSADTSTGANSGKNVKITIFQSKIIIIEKMSARNQMRCGIDDVSAQY